MPFILPLHLIHGIHKNCIFARSYALRMYLMVRTVKSVTLVRSMRTHAQFKERRNAYGISCSGYMHIFLFCCAERFITVHTRTHIIIFFKCWENASSFVNSSWSCHLCNQNVWNIISVVCGDSCTVHTLIEGWSHFLCRIFFSLSKKKENLVRLVVRRFCSIMLMFL